MRRISFQASLVVAMTALILIFPACLRISDLAGARLLSADLNFENPDQDDMLSYPPDQAKAFASAISPFKGLAGSIFFDRVSSSELLGSFSDHRASPLRC